MIKIPADAGIPFDPDETGASFAENALIKARELRRLIAAAGFPDPVIADDSGLCVDALEGRPGIRSARYGADGGHKLSDRDRNALLLRELGDNPNRGARFVCAMALLFAGDRFFLAQETLEGELIAAAQGEGGFGYDPILFIPHLSGMVSAKAWNEAARYCPGSPWAAPWRSSPGRRRTGSATGARQAGRWLRCWRKGASRGFAIPMARPRETL